MAVHDHLKFSREVLVNPKRPRRPPPQKPRGDLVSHAQRLNQSFTEARAKASELIPGYDDRLLFKIEIDDFQGAFLDAFPGVEIISQEEKGVYLVFSDTAAIEIFEARLAGLIEGERVSRQAILEALESFDTMSADDRKGWALAQKGWPNTIDFMLDVELWPLGLQGERQALTRAFEQWLVKVGIELLDSVKQPTAIIYRIRVTTAQAEQLLIHRDVRQIDLPPQFQLDMRLLGLDIQDIPNPPEPPAGAPGLVVLDSGLTSNHPLLRSAIGEATSYVDGKDADDEHGHGTHVAGIALYDDLEEKLEAGEFVPELRLFSGRILDENNEANTKLIEHQVEIAVRYFNSEYDCRVFNLSYGDLNKRYRGGRMNGLAVTLDYLARELDVLFVVPTGNFYGTDTIPKNWLDDYPYYLLEDEASLLDPAPAFNAVTVGSMARYDSTRNSVRYPLDPAERPIAQKRGVSPFSRSGLGHNGVIKPEFVAYGGNMAIDTRSGSLVTRALGEISLNRDFVNGHVVSEDIGGSYACPHVSHIATRLISVYPEIGLNELRALLAAHAFMPEEILNSVHSVKDRLRLAGYGEIDQEAIFKSTDDSLSIIANARIANKSHHFYELPIPKEFWSGSKRLRQMSIALAYAPLVRTTRLDYKASRISFKVIKAHDLEDVQRRFNNNIPIEETKKVNESGNRNIKEMERGRGTLQSACWDFKIVNARERQKKWFVVITRHDYPWAEGYTEEQESYDLVVSLRDRENEQARLYEQVQAIIRERGRVAQQARG